MGEYVIEILLLILGATNAIWFYTLNSRAKMSLKLIQDQQEKLMRVEKSQLEIYKILQDIRSYISANRKAKFRRITEFEKRDILQRKAKNQSNKEIAEAYGMSETTIYYILHPDKVQQRNDKIKEYQQKKLKVTHGTNTSFRGAQQAQSREVGTSTQAPS